MYKSLIAPVVFGIFLFLGVAFSFPPAAFVGLVGWLAVTGYTFIQHVRTQRLEAYTDDLEVSPSESKLADMEDGERLVLDDGRVVCRVGDKFYQRAVNRDGLFYAKDITPRIDSSLREQSPSVNEMEDVTRRKAEEQLSASLEGADLTHRVLVAEILKKAKRRCNIGLASEQPSDAAPALCIEKIPGFSSLLTPEAKAVYDTAVKTTIIKREEPEGDDIVQRIYPVQYLSTVVRIGRDEELKDPKAAIKKVAEVAASMARVINYCVAEGLLGHGTLAPASIVKLVTPNSPLERGFAVFCFMGVGPEYKVYVEEYTRARDAFMKERGISEDEVSDYWKTDGTPNPLADFKFPHLTDWLNAKLGSDWFVSEGDLGNESSTLKVPAGAPTVVPKRKPRKKAVRKPKTT